jgi:hypothetical protein
VGGGVGGSGSRGGEGRSLGIDVGGEDLVCMGGKPSRARTRGWRGGGRGGGAVDGGGSRSGVLVGVAV